MVEKIIKNYHLILFTLAVITASGCSGLFTTYTPTIEYDLIVKPVKITKPVQVYQFRNDSTASARFQIKDDSGNTVNDPYRKWVSEPGRLITRALNSLLASDNSQAKYKLTGTIDCFEIERTKKIFKVSGFYSFIKPHRTDDIRFSIQVPLKNITSEEITLAASRAVQILAERISSGLPESKKQK
jgi:hypothetical protein